MDFIVLEMLLIRPGRIIVLARLLYVFNILLLRLEQRRPTLSFGPFQESIGFSAESGILNSVVKGSFCFVSFFSLGAYTLMGLLQIMLSLFLSAGSRFVP